MIDQVTTCTPKTTKPTTARSVDLFRDDISKKCKSRNKTQEPHAQSHSKIRRIGMRANSGYINLDIFMLK